MDSISSVDSTISGRTTSSVSSAGGTAPYLAHWDQTRSSLLERLSQWEFVPDNILQSSPPLPSAVYGAVHLTRLLVKLPGMLSNSVLTDEKIEYILEVVQDLAEYVSEHEEWFRPNIYVNNTF
uniref:Protein male-specific lethal-3 n=1 Tax=Cacopsylla melanoneura TaxID=428564 RepID=A0A8D8WWY7_9HEMI